MRDGQDQPEGDRQPALPGRARRDELHGRLLDNCKGAPAGNDRVSLIRIAGHEQGPHFPPMARQSVDRPCDISENTVRNNTVKW